MNAESRVLEEALEECMNRLRAAERVCVLYGWCPARDGTQREKALHQVWADWSVLVPGNYMDRRHWPDLNKEAIERLAAERDRIRARTLALIEERIEESSIVPDPRRTRLEHQLLLIDRLDELYQECPEDEREAWDEYAAAGNQRLRRRIREKLDEIEGEDCDGDIWANDGA